MELKSNPILSIKNLYKIFGPAPELAMEQVREGIGKSELMQQHSHVMGLNNISIDMQEGEITVIMGLSGSGKSTLIRHLNRLIEPTSGQVVVNGVDVTKLSEVKLRELRRTTMSMVFQKFALLPHCTVLENVGMALWVRGEKLAKTQRKCSEYLKRVGLEGFDNHYPNQLSGGMQQRVGIARALASDAPIMLMDEAFSALDPLIRTDMQNLLLDLQKELNKTIVFITHDLDEALKIADHLVILKDGHVVQQGDPQDILMCPNDPYIEDFVGDINRARVLRVKSVMQPLENCDFAGDVDVNDNLESVISVSGGDTSLHYRVLEGGAPIGELHMRDLVKALVPRKPTYNSYSTPTAVGF